MNRVWNWSDRVKGNPNIWATTAPTRTKMKKKENKPSDLAGIEVLHAHISLLFLCMQHFAQSHISLSHRSHFVSPEILVDWSISIDWNSWNCCEKYNLFIEHASEQCYTFFPSSDVLLVYFDLFDRKTHKFLLFFPFIFFPVSMWILAGERNFYLFHCEASREAHNPPEIA